MNSLGDMSARIALVTGAANGVGRATAESLAKRGATVAITDQDGDALSRAAESISKNSRVLAIVADLASAEATSNIVPKVAEELGGLDILVNAAGDAPRGHLLTTDVAEWDRTLAVNLRAAFQLMQEASRIMIDSKSEGAIVNVGSINCHGGQPDLCAYSIAKAGLVALTKNAAFGLMPYRIRVNVVNFGWMHTPGEVKVQRKYYQRDENRLKAAGAKRWFGRLISPEEAGRMIVFLASPESGVMTGAAIDYDQSVPGAGPPSIPPNDGQ